MSDSMIRKLRASRMAVSVAIVLILLGKGTPSLAHEVEFRLQSETGDPLTGEFTWVIFGPTGSQKVQSSGEGHTMSLDDGEYSVIVMRTEAETAQDFTFHVDGADRVVSVVFAPPPGMIQPEEVVRHWVTINLLNEPAPTGRVSEYRWRLAHDDEVFFNKSEPEARLRVPLESRETEITVTRIPDLETVRFQITPNGTPDQAFEFAWPAVSVGQVLPEEKAKPPSVSVALDPRIDGDRLIVALTFEKGAPVEGDAVWLEDGAPGALGMAFVEPDSSALLLDLPRTASENDLRVTYRRAQTFVVVGLATVPRE